MKRFLSLLWRIVTSPVRFVQWIIQSIRDAWHRLGLFFTEVPEDVSLTETFTESFGSRDVLWETLGALGEHFVALRNAVFRACIALGLTTLLSFFYAQKLMDILAVPLGPNGTKILQVIEPTEAIGVFMRVSLLSGLAFAMPWIVLEIYLFVAPGLMPRSRLFLLGAIPAASVLFLAGMAFTYFIMLPAAIPFLQNFLGFKAAWRPSAYFGLVTSLMFWIGIAFQMPLLVYSLAGIGWIKASQLARQWKIAVVVIAVVAAAVTPTVDPVNMGLVMLPMFGLYGLSIAGAAIAGAGRRRDLAQQAALKEAKAAEKDKEAVP
jgi:sec-independent protein translocase protein TatC